MATAADANLMLKLYELRREETMRAARHFMVTEFQPTEASEILALQGRRGSRENGYLRQVLSYWEMAASFVLQDALDEDLYVATTSEPFLLLAKFDRFQGELEARTGARLLPMTGKIAERSPVAAERVARLKQQMAAAEHVRTQAVTRV